MDTSKNVCSYYTLHRQEDNCGNTVLETSFRGLMWKCVNFIEDGTLLQTNGHNMRQNRGHMIVNLILKCHPNLASEGIEYSWGCVNIYYMQLLLDKKKDKKYFKKCSRGNIKRQLYHK